MTQALAICDSPQAIALASKRWPQARQVIDNPLLTDVEPGGQILNSDALLTQADALRLGTLALELTRDIDAAIAASPLPARYGLLPTCVHLTGSMSRLIASLLHRTTALARALTTGDIDRIQIATLETGRWGERNPFVLPWFAHPARALAERGFFASRSWEYVPVETALPSTINDTASRSLMRRALVMPKGVVLQEALDRLSGPGNAVSTIRIGEVNEALRETLPHLRSSGLTWQSAKSIRSVSALSNSSFAESPVIAPDVRALLDALIHDRLSGSGWLDPSQSRALTDLICIHISAGLTHLAGQVELLREAIAADFPSGGVLLSNGLFGPAGAQAYGLYRQQGVRIVEFEHGVTAGISALTDTKITHAIPPQADLHLVCSRRSAASFQGNGTTDHRVAAIGLPDSVRRMQHAPLQRLLARRALGLRSRDLVVMHVSTTPYFANQRPGLGAPTETTTYRIDKTLLTEVYPALPHRIIFKQYPAQRFPYEPRYDEIWRLPPHVTVTKDEDFRYIRAAADVIVTMTPTSTLGWCVGTGKPIVWLFSRLISPLSDAQLEGAFMAAFPNVDIDSNGWADRLRAKLADIPGLKADWNARAAPRSELYEDAITGPPGISGERAAEAVLDFLASAPEPTGSRVRANPTRP